MSADMKKTIKFHKRLSITTVIVVSIMLLMLMGAGKMSSFAEISDGVEEFSFSYIKVPLDTEQLCESELVRIEKGEAHFDELLAIVSKYTFEETDGEKFAGKNGIYCEVDPDYILTMKTYGKFMSKDTFSIADTGELRLNQYNYKMENAPKMIEELMAYSTENKIFRELTNLS